jgi:SOS-response transcriptional repressor LexA
VRTVQLSSVKKLTVRQQQVLDFIRSQLQTEGLLPTLREITLEGLPGVTREAASKFPTEVQVNYS